MAFGLTPWDPFREVDRLFRRGIENPLARLAEAAPALPAVEITDEDDHYLVRAEIPGVSEEDLEIFMTGNLLTLRGEKKTVRREGRTIETKPGGEEKGKAEKGKVEKVEEKKEAAGKQQEREGETGERRGRPLYSECFYGSFERTLSLPDDIDPDRIEASSKDGVIFIRIGKEEAQRPRRIAIGKGGQKQLTH